MTYDPQLNNQDFPSKVKPIIQSLDRRIKAMQKRIRKLEKINEEIKEDEEITI